MSDKTLRKCRWCHRVLDPAAPLHAGAPANLTSRRERPHCGDASTTCDWGDYCHGRQIAAIQAGHSQLLRPADSPDEGSSPDGQTS